MCAWKNYGYKLKDQKRDFWIQQQTKINNFVMTTKCVNGSEYTIHRFDSLRPKAEQVISEFTQCRSHH